MDQEFRAPNGSGLGGDYGDLANALDALELNLKCCDEHNTILINRKGPLLLKLRLESFAGASLPSIIGFDVDDNNKSGEIEIDGRFSVGDYLIQINGKATKNMELADVFQLLQEVGGEYRKLVFMKPLGKCSSSLGEQLAKSVPTEVLEEGPGGRVKACSSDALIQNVHNIFLKAEVIDAETSEINYAKLQTISASGLNDTVRCIVWSILLGCLSPITIVDGDDPVVEPGVPMRRGGRWLEELQGNFSEYDEICSHMLVLGQNLDDSLAGVRVRPPPPTADVDAGPHPPSGGWCVSTLTIRPPDVPLYAEDAEEKAVEGGSSGASIVAEASAGDTAAKGEASAKVPNMDPRWEAYYADLILADNIARDVTRTLPHIAFFTVHNVTPTTRSLAGETAAGEGGELEVEPPDVGAGNPLATNSHLQSIERVLYVHAKLNHALKYVQGMNEIAGTLYYVMANSPVPAIREHAEAHAYHCFMSLMVEMQDLFIEEMDDSVFGVYARIRQYDTLLKHTDPELHAWLVDELGIESHLYTFRWFTTLFTREFTLPDVIRIWDTLFADNDRKTFVLYVAVAMACTLRDQLLQGDFTDNLTLLQTFPPDISVTDILDQALRLRVRDRCGHSVQSQAKRRSFVEMAASFSSSLKAYSTSSGNSGSGSNSAVECSSPAPAASQGTPTGSADSPVGRGEGGSASVPSKTPALAPAGSGSASESLRASFTAAVGGSSFNFRGALSSMMKSSAPAAPVVVVMEDEHKEVSSTMTEVVVEEDEDGEGKDAAAAAVKNGASVPAPVPPVSSVRTSIRSSFSQLWSRTSLLVPSVVAGVDEESDSSEVTGRLSESDAALVSAFYKPDGGAEESTTSDPSGDTNVQLDRNSMTDVSLEL